MQKNKEREYMFQGERALNRTRWAGSALVLAGGLWIITYLAGVLERRLIDPDFFDGSMVMWIGLIASEAAQFCLGAGLIVLGTCLWTRAKGLAGWGMVLETSALVTLSIDLVLFPSLFGGRFSLVSSRR